MFFEKFEDTVRENETIAAAVLPKYRTLIPEYVKDYVSLNQFAA